MKFFNFFLNFIFFYWNFNWRLKSGDDDLFSDSMWFSESSLCPDENGSRIHTNKCLSGRRWSGDYTGDFGYLV